MAYDAFGTQTAGMKASVKQPFGFTGYMADAVSGMWFAQARYYDAAQGRFTGQDPVKGNVVVPKSLNPYTYCWGNPLGMTDKDGRWPMPGPPDPLWAHDNLLSHWPAEAPPMSRNDVWGDDCALDFLIRRSLGGFIVSRDSWSRFGSAAVREMHVILNDLRRFGAWVGRGRDGILDIW